MPLRLELLLYRALLSETTWLAHHRGWQHGTWSSSSEGRGAVGRHPVIRARLWCALLIMPGGHHMTSALACTTEQETMSDKVLVSSSAFSDRDRHPTLQSCWFVVGPPLWVWRGLSAAALAHIALSKLGLSRNFASLGGIPCGGG